MWMLLYPCKLLPLLAADVLHGAFRQRSTAQFTFSLGQANVITVYYFVLMQLPCIFLQ